MILMALVIGACAGSAQPTSTTTPTPSSTSVPTATTPTQTLGGNGEIPSDFPIPIMEGGTTESAYATEVTVLYPEASYDQLLDFYNDLADANEGIAHDMFVGREWEVQGATISVTPVDQTTHPDRQPGMVLFIRLP